ncbi:hypothetical protein B9Z55_003820 [Caenorhabditis nigoni]|uniref:Sdz-33 F-box domain-containing protein n=1 Tax=Caenorhabditis nigoni TaxID=1611254 RepID=A0A2G5VSJ0_9PELO|nr:hypothetical protein B9Z55_003820 [Caenorhabditis nigoni]
MELNEILLLSFCSKRVQKSIKEQFKIEPNEGFRITCGTDCPELFTVHHCYDLDDRKILELIVDHKENDKKVINWRYVDSLENLHRRIQILREFKFLEDWYPYKGVNIQLKSELIVRFKCRLSFDPKSGIPTVYFMKDLMKKWPMELHKYCVDLFRTTPDLEMIMNLNDSSDFPESQTIKDLYLHNSCKSLNVTIAEEFFEKANIQNKLSTKRLRLDGAISDDSKLWDIPNLYIFCWVYARQLTRFTGKNAFFFTRDLPQNLTKNMNAFLKHWLNSTNTNLETMMAVTYRRFTEELFDGIQTSRWDPNKRPARYVIKESLGRVLEHHSGEGDKFAKDFGFKFDYLDCTDAFDIVRESDGLMASVKVRNSIFIMFVWHSTFS